MTKVALNKNIQLRCGVCSCIKFAQHLSKNANKRQFLKGNRVSQIKVMVNVVNAVSVQLVCNARQGSLNLKASRALSTCTNITEREGRQLGKIFRSIRCFLLQTECLNFCTNLLDVFISKCRAKLL